MTQKILVTGGAGYIGSHTVTALFASGYAPVIVDDFSNSSKSVLDGIARIVGSTPICYEGDCKDKAFLTNVFAREGDIAGVIHFAAHKAVAESVREPIKYYRNNIDSLLVLLEAMKEYGVLPLVFSSSATVYGTPVSNPIPETAPMQTPESPYGATKIIGEGIIRDSVASGSWLSAIALRYFNPIGAHPSGEIGELPLGVPNNLLPYLTQVAIGKREKLTVFGNDYDTPDGTCIRDYLHVADLADAHCAALAFLLKQPAPYYDVFNVGTGMGHSVIDLIQEFERASNITLKYEIGERRPGDVPVCYADVTKINNVLGWKGKHTFFEALTDAWRWETRLAQRNPID